MDIKKQEITENKLIKFIEKRTDSIEEKLGILEDRNKKEESLTVIENLKKKQKNIEPKVIKKEKEEEDFKSETLEILHKIKETGDKFSDSLKKELNEHDKKIQSLNNKKERAKKLHNISNVVAGDVSVAAVVGKKLHKIVRKTPVYGMGIRQTIGAGMAVNKFTNEVSEKGFLKTLRDRSVDRKFRNEEKLIHSSRNKTDLQSRIQDRTNNKISNSINHLNGDLRDDNTPDENIKQIQQQRKELHKSELESFIKHNQKTKNNKDNSGMFSPSSLSVMSSLPQVLDKSISISKGLPPVNTTTTNLPKKISEFTDNNDIKDILKYNKDSSKAIKSMASSLKYISDNLVDEQDTSINTQRSKLYSTKKSDPKLAKEDNNVKDPLDLGLLGDLLGNGIDFDRRKGGRYGSYSRNGRVDQTRRNKRLNEKRQRRIDRLRKNKGWMSRIGGMFSGPEPEIDFDERREKREQRRYRAQGNTNNYNTPNDDFKTRKERRRQNYENRTGKKSRASNVSNLLTNTVNCCCDSSNFGIDTPDRNDKKSRRQQRKEKLKNKINLDTKSNTDLKKLSGGLDDVSKKPASKLAGGGIKALANGAKAIPLLGTAIAAGMTIFDAKEGWDNSEEITGTKNNSISQKLGAASSNVLSGLSFGLVDAKDIYSTGSNMVNSFGGTGNKHQSAGNSWTGGFFDKVKNLATGNGFNTTQGVTDKKTKEVYQSINKRFKGDEKIGAFIKLAETGDMMGKYASAADIGDKAGITFGAYQFTEKSGGLASFLDKYYQQTQDGKALDIYKRLQTAKKGKRFLEGREKEYAISYLKQIGNSSISKQIQDNKFSNDYLAMGKRIAKEFKITDYDSIGQIVDHAHNAGEGGAKRMLKMAPNFTPKGIAEGRKKFYLDLVRRMPDKAKFLKGWLNRVEKASLSFNAGGGQFVDKTPVQQQKASQPATQPKPPAKKEEKKAQPNTQQNSSSSGSRPPKHKPVDLPTKTNGDTKFSEANAGSGSDVNTSGSGSNTLTPMIVNTDVDGAFKGNSTEGLNVASGVTTSGSNDAFLDNVAGMATAFKQNYGRDLVLTSAFRNPAKQKQLWEEALVKYGSPEEARKWVAPPGRSKHEQGIAVDINYAPSGKRDIDLAEKSGLMKTFGLYRPLSNEHWHIEPIGSRGGSVPDGKGKPNQQPSGKTKDKQAKKTNNNKASQPVPVPKNSKDDIAGGKINQPVGGQNVQQVTNQNVDVVKKTNTPMANNVGSDAKSMVQSTVATNIPAQQPQQQTGNINVINNSNGDSSKKGLSISDVGKGNITNPAFLYSFANK